MNDFNCQGFDSNNAGHQAFNSFLQLDIQQYQDELEALIMAIEQIQQGKLQDWQGGGNAYFCDITDQGAQLEITMDDIDDTDIPMVSLEYCLSAAKAWLIRCQVK